MDLLIQAATQDRDEWIKLWDPSSPMTLKEFLSQEPKYAIKKTNTVHCTLIHDHDSPLALHKHKMKSRLTACTSSRCHFQLDEDGQYCTARYKINVCDEAPDVCVVLKQGFHLSDLNEDGPLESPRDTTLSPVLREWIESTLEEHPTVTPAKLRETILLKIQAQCFVGEEIPRLAQVQNFVKSWRRRQPVFSRDVDIVEEFVNQNLFDPSTFTRIPDDTPVYLARTEVTNGVRKVHLGDGSLTKKFRLGVTCRRLIVKFLTVQADNITILHVDSTFGVVNARYSFFAFGISDRRGVYHPLAFFCTSHRTASDIAWCIAQMKEVSLVCGGTFMPDFVMTDADDAQLNAVDQELECPILMCWFHVTQNVEKKLKQFRVGIEMSKQVWRDVYAMHYARSHEQFLDVRTSVLARWSQLSNDDSAMSRFCTHFKRQWMSPESRFSKWQVYHTPAGYSKSNNPLEQYHGQLKSSLGLNKNSSVFSLAEAMTKGVQFTLCAERFEFEDDCGVSYRMLRRYKKLKEIGLVVATREPGDGNPSFRIHQVTYEDALDQFQQASDHKSLTLLQKMGDQMKHRHECYNQPELGWQVNSLRRDCLCDQWFKHGVCVHVIHACMIDQQECPGVPRPKRRFVNPTLRTRARSVRGRASRRAQSNIDANPLPDLGSPDI